jgi:hypothetical protein
MSINKEKTEKSKIDWQAVRRQAIAFGLQVAAAAASGAAFGMSQSIVSRPTKPLETAKVVPFPNLKQG